MRNLKQWSFYTKPRDELHQDLVEIKESNYKRLSDSEFLRVLLELAIRVVKNQSPTGD